MKHQRGWNEVQRTFFGPSYSICNSVRQLRIESDSFSGQYTRAQRQMYGILYQTAVLQDAFLVSDKEPPPRGVFVPPPSPGLAKLHLANRYC